jgi:hypothetical protein
MLGIDSGARPASIYDSEPVFLSGPQAPGGSKT